MALSISTMDMIARRELLPKLESLTCFVMKDFNEFMNMLELRWLAAL
jgi:hypothetical protein